MKKITTFLILCLIFVSCSKDDTPTEDPNGNGNPTNNASSITFENNTFTGSCVVTYSDGTIYNGTFTNGKMDIPSTGTNKIIASIQPQNQQIIIIGRKEGISLKLNYNGSTLSHRTAVNGFIPISTFAEFQLINLNTTTLAGIYKQEDTLYFMNNVWTPIGTSNAPFNGTFDGNNKEINQLNVSVTGGTNPAGLFGIASSNSQLINIIIKSGTVKGQYNAAGVAAECGFITNCKNYAKIEGNQVSGVAWSINIQNNEISNCHNYGIIKSNSGGLCSGVFGSAFGNTIKDCTNNNVLNGSEVCGIVRNASNVQSCINNGSIVSNGGFATGIASYVSSVKNCTNNGIISGNNDVYGIVSGDQNGCNVENCINTANLTTSNYQFCSGIGGGGFGKIVKNCNNSGNINTSGSAGNVSGITSSGNISNCHNTGNIVASSNSTTYKPNCGGIGSKASFGNIIDCTNTGNIESNGGKAAGIVAIGAGTIPSGGLIISRCYNTGNINGEYSGGICGYSETTNGVFNILACYNSGTITSTTNSLGLNSGGILGSHYQIGTYKIENCYNIGNSNGGSMIGVSQQFNTGNFTVTISNCFWKQGTATFAIAKIFGYQGSVSTSNVGTTLFSATAWPSTTNGWTSTDWKSLGSWNNGNPTYPKLIFEN